MQHTSTISRILKTDTSIQRILSGKFVTTVLALTATVTTPNLEEHLISHLLIAIKHRRISYETIGMIFLGDRKKNKEKLHEKKKLSKQQRH